VFDEFTERMVPGERVPVFTRAAGKGPVVLLLHGHPRTSATWHRVGPALVAAGFSVVAADLPGYGRSGKPAPAPDHQTHSKRLGARDLAAAMRNLGHDRFAVVGHDRGSNFALRLALDHPSAVTHAVFLDSLPISEHLDRCDAAFAAAWWHWFFFAQPEVPERVIMADPDRWYLGNPETMGEENYAEFRTATRDPDVVRGMLEDYRAGLTVDAADERDDRAAGRRLHQPVLVLWSTQDDLVALHGDPLAIWRRWADSVGGHGVDSPHHMAEAAPDALVDALVLFLTPSAGPA
jgi:haloacetate dehalogenase